MYLTILNIITIVLLTVAGMSLLSSLLHFIRAQFMMLSYYILSSNIETNQRAAVQYEALSQFSRQATASFKQAAWSLMLVGVIILARYIAGVVLYANL